ncbi:hypothetical protein QYF36_022997 [Acer negundo]|nr:hypothetical protein QYF36_022997 [Acer negundo]
MKREQKPPGVNFWSEEEDMEEVGEKVGRIRQSRLGDCETQKEARWWFKRCQNKVGKVARRKKREAE